jgi:hypothetical protein
MADPHYGMLSPAASCLAHMNGAKHVTDADTPLLKLGKKGNQWYVWVCQYCNLLYATKV